MEKVGYEHEEQGHLERRESLGWITGAHAVPTGCFSAKSGTEPQSPKSLCYYTVEKMCQTHWASVNCMRRNSLLLLLIVFGRELDCRHKGLNAAASVGFSTDTSADVRRPFLKIIFK